jgi:hypothetical protein
MFVNFCEPLSINLVIFERPGALQLMLKLAMPHPTFLTLSIDLLDLFGISNLYATRHVDAALSIL